MSHHHQWTFECELFKALDMSVVLWYIVCIVGAAVSTWILGGFIQWLKKWYALHYLPGPQDWIPFWMLVTMYWNRADNNNVTHYIFTEINRLCDEYKKTGIFRTYLGFKPVVILCKPETCEPILSSAVNIRKPYTYHFLHPWLGKKSLVTGTGSIWRAHRKLLTPAFHFKILEQFQPIFNEQSMTFVDRLRRTWKGKDEFMPLFPLTANCTLDIIGETSMGYQLNSQTSECSYGRAIITFGYLVVVRSLRPWMWPDYIYKKTSEGKLAAESVSTMHELSRAVIRERRDWHLKRKKYNDMNNNEIIMDQNENYITGTKTKRLAFLDLLLEIHFKEPSFTLEDIREEVDTTLFAGHDTTATGISWTIYLLGLNPEKQRKAQAEVDKIFESKPGKRTIDLEDLKNLKYIEACFKEGLRHYPPVPMLGRILDEDAIIEGHRIPKGTMVYMNAYKVQRDESNYPNPDAYEPERFLAENSVGRHPFSFIAFSGGLRNCIGQKFAIMEAKTILAHVLRNFNIHSSWPIEKLKLCFEMIIRAKGGLRVKFEPRNLAAAS